MMFPRSSGVLLHPTSLPSPYGIGDIGRAARAFIDRLHTAGQLWWQVLPLNIPGFGGSPYAAQSAFACNPAIIDLDDLVADGLLSADELDGLVAEARWLDGLDPTRAALDEAAALKMAALRLAWERVHSGHVSAAYLDMFERFCAEKASWIEDWALFAALKKRYQDADWRSWPAELVRCDAAALEAARAELSYEIGLHKFIQYVFAMQWAALREHGDNVGVQIIGDIPIFVAMDSADVWANRALFEMSAEGVASAVAGVPPDYFSKTGQKWGNPLYAWQEHEDTNWAWWTERVRAALELCDVVRIDHFRGFEAYWAVPADAPTAETGRWVKAPGDKLFNHLREVLGEVPFIAEDLGLITDEVHRLRDRHELPGMKVMHFAFSGEPDHPFLPHTYPRRCVAYAGTHDNDTTRGWFDHLSAEEQHRVRVYLGSDDAGIVRAMRRKLYASQAELVIVTAQDVLELGSEAKMNTPATTQGNWTWRMTQGQLEDAAWERLGEEARAAQRA
jgi:4-alpha-glucanotransferase